MSNAFARRRPLATAAAAAGLLFALGFVPSAQASPEPAPPEASVPAVPMHAAAGPRFADGSGHQDTGTDPAPYVLGVAGLAGAGGLLAARA
ncbi:hypothetical protein N566_25445, partial [Streptomycetaceae bacterium MP113-05]